MKIYTKVRINIETGETLEEESFEYDGPMALCYGELGDTSDSSVGHGMGEDTSSESGFAPHGSSAAAAAFGRPALQAWENTALPGIWGKMGFTNKHAAIGKSLFGVAIGAISPSSAIGALGSTVKGIRDAQKEALAAAGVPADKLDATLNATIASWGDPSDNVDEGGPSGGNREDPSGTGTLGGNTGGGTTEPTPIVPPDAIVPGQMGGQLSQMGGSLVAPRVNLSPGLLNQIRARSPQNGLVNQVTGMPQQPGGIPQFQTDNFYGNSQTGVPYR